jgi:hypothetical protein
MSQNPNANPSPDNFNDVEAKAEQERKEAAYPKKTDGSVDVDALTTEQKAEYWKDRHDASTRGFHQFKAKTDAEIETLKKSLPPTPSKEAVNAAAANAETLEDFEKSIPNFELLDIDTQTNLRAIFTALENRVFSKLNNDPGVAFARQTFNEQKWEKAFNAIAPAFGEDLSKKKEDFKSKYFQPHNVPDNIEEILTQLAKSYLYDSAKEKGAEEARLQDQERVDLARGNGGPKSPQSGMSLDDWDHLRRTNPKEFARRAPEYNAAMAAGQLQE